MVGCENRADFVVTNARHIDQEAEHARPEEVPKTDRHQEIECPAVAFDHGCASPRHPHEVPGVERDERQRHDLERGERSGNRHVQLSLTGPVPMMARADEAAAEIEDRVQVNRAQRSETLDEAHLIENDRYDYGDEELEEALDPQMNDPEAPRIDDGVVGLRTEEQRRQIEERDGEGRDQKEVGKAAPFRIAAGGRHRAPDEEEPIQQTDGEQDLPETPDLQIFPALIAEPEPAVWKPLEQARPFAEHAV